MRLKNRWLWILAIPIVAALVLSAGWFRYYPQYQENQGAVFVSADGRDNIRLMSRNLRCLTPLDFGKKSWFYRAPMIMEEIQQEAPGIIGFQEATSWQYRYLSKRLTGYDSVITYRDDSKLSEGCPVFYNRSLYSLVEKGSFWLSDTPETMSKSWGSQEYRICSYIVLEDRESLQEFAVFNTHLDHVSDEARINGMRVILKKLEQLGDLPYVIMGDLNAEEGSETYEMATEYCLDARDAAEETADGPTYQGWGDPEQQRRIDYFLVSPEGLSVKRYKAVSALQDGCYSSDHNAIIMDMDLHRLRVMTFNVRILTDSDKGDRRWKIRKSLVVEDILNRDPGVVCLQEVKPRQQTYLEKNLTDYEGYIVYRTDQENTEGCPIFWKKEDYTLVEKGNIWLSKTPEKSSKDWDATYPQTCTYVILRDHQTGKDFGVFNIHLNHVSAEAKVKGMGVVLQLLEQYSDIPCLLAGDYNVQMDSPTYRLVSRYLEDGLYTAENASGFGTYFAWGKLEEGRRIDYIMMSPEDFTVRQYHVIPVLHEDIYASDHCPVVMEATFRK